MTISDLAHKTQRTVVDNSPAILTALGVSGVAGTAYLAAKAGMEAGTLILEDEIVRQRRGEPVVDVTVKETAKLVWKKFIPAAISGALTVGCVVMANRSSAKRTAVAYSLLTVSERAFTEYKDKVVETMGAKKEKTVRDAVAQDKVTANPPPATVVLGSGTVICLELWSGRYFMCDVETLRRAQNKINDKLLKHDEATLTDFYHEVGLPLTSASSMQGWQSTKLLELSFSTAVTEDMKPCITFDYNYVYPF